MRGMDLSRFRDLLPGLTSGGPPVLPAWLDRLSEWWWGRPPRLRTVLVAVAILLGLVVIGRGATRSPWGPPTQVLVATADLEPGTPIDGDRLRAAQWPGGLVPDDAIIAVADLPDDARVRSNVPAGTPLTARHLVTGLAGLVAPGHVAVSVPRDGLPIVPTGARVDVVTAGVHGEAARITAGARVLALDGDWVWLGVPAEQADAVATAAVTGRVLLAIRPD
jgi:Flp pilus assembly protein CpaB